VCRAPADPGAGMRVSALRASIPSVIRSAGSSPFLRACPMSNYGVRSGRTWTTRPSRSLTRPGDSELPDRRRLVESASYDRSTHWSQHALVQTKGSVTSETVPLSTRIKILRSRFGSRKLNNRPLVKKRHGGYLSVMNFLRAQHFIRRPR
jgi:predicted neuraminidase